MSEVRPRLPFESFTFADVERFQNKGNRYEIIDGCMWVTADPAAGQQSIISKLSGLLEAAAPPALRVTQGVGVLLEEAGSESQYLIPDVLVVDRAATGAPAYRPGDVHLAVEVVSPQTVTLDRVTKRYVYGQLGIANYWIVEPAEPGRVTVLTLDQKGAYAENQVVVGAQELVGDDPFEFRVVVEALLA